MHFFLHIYILTYVRSARGNLSIFLSSVLISTNNFRYDITVQYQFDCSSPRYLCLSPYLINIKSILIRIQWHFRQAFSNTQFYEPNFSLKCKSNQITSSKLRHYPIAMIVLKPHLLPNFYHGGGKLLYFFKSYYLSSKLWQFSLTIFKLHVC